jgi:hypothetical protein
LVPLGLKAVVLHILSAKDFKIYNFEKHSYTHILCALTTITKNKIFINKKITPPHEKGVHEEG